MARQIKDVKIRVPAAPLVGDDNPSNWSITPDGDNITAVNSVSGNTFSGTIQEFNCLINPERRKDTVDVTPDSIQ